jgi:dipeptidyl aminopeptidase/acylaminoacyl peptidase
MRKLFGVLALALTLGAAAASAAISSGSSIRNGPLTLFVGGTSGFDPEGGARIVTIGGRKQTTIWHCPRNNWCGEAVSFAWRPDGRRLAFTLDAIGGQSPYIGFDLLNVVSGRDTVVPRDRVGCFPASQLACSPDGSRLAYSCESSDSGRSSESHLDVLELRGSGHTTVWTGSSAFWPSWSPDGTRLVYSTLLQATKRRGGIFTVGLHGSHHRRLVARGAAPAWSPDGKTIAYETNCGIRLATPAGKDVTPRAAANRCGSLGFSGPPLWSPDGTKLAVETTHKHGIYVMDKNGGGLHWLSLGLRETRTWYHHLPGRPSWRPLR